MRQGCNKGVMLMDTILEEYVRKHPGSAQRYEEAKDLFPGGVTHDNRHIAPFPIYMSHGKGPLKWDVDGHEYVDYVCGHGALILGHSHPKIASAVAEQVARGTHLGASTDEEMRWASAIKALMPSVEKVRFHSSGTEATLMALRLARAYTGKTKVVKFQDHFHGWHDYLVATGTGPVPGVPAATTASVVVLPPDISTVEATLSQDGGRGGGDPGAYGRPLRPAATAGAAVPQKDLRQLTFKYGVLLIMDEVVTGFRVSPGGAQERFGVDPDLTTMAKIVAGGLPGGAVGGRAEILDMLAFREDPAWDNGRRVPHPGTFNANPLSAAAGATCLEMVASEPIVERAGAMADRLKRGLNDVFSRLEVSWHAHGLASLVHLTLEECACDREVCTMPHHEIKRAADPAVSLQLKRALLNAGVDMMGRGAFIVSAAHGEQDIDRTMEAFEGALGALR